MRVAALAPVCPHCGVRIVGHGVQHGDTIFCCLHCAKHEGVKGLVDRD
jgi:nitrite reductase/ring-hydroxylating ferredoxin subunit